MARQKEKRLRILAMVVATAACAWLVGTAIFLFDHENTRFVARLDDDFGTSHNCVTAYVTAAYLASEREENIYDPSRYRNAEIPTPIHHAVRDVFSVDSFHYPPSFLPLPYVMRSLFGDFAAVRAAWFTLTILVLGGALATIALWAGALRTQYVLLLLPVAFLAPTFHVALQIGNVHVLVIGLSMLAMVLVEKRHAALGGALLGAAVAFKLWPGILLALLLVQRRWRAAMASVGTVAAFVLVSVILFGAGPYRAFVTFQLPRIANGDAFSFMATVPRALRANMSVMGVPHKLHALGLTGEPPLVSQPLAWIFTALVVAVFFVVARRRTVWDADDDESRLAKACLWLSLLTLVQLRSPFLPWTYGTLSAVLLLTFLGTTAKGWMLVGVAGAWIVTAVNLPFPFVSNVAPEFYYVYTLFALAVVFAAIVAGLRLALRRKDSNLGTAD